MATLGKDDHAAGATPGSACTVRGSGGGRTPGSLCGSKPGAMAQRRPEDSAKAAEEQRKKSQYLSYARSVSYAMDAKSEGQSIEKWLHMNVRVQSDLGGAFLRMYLKGQKDPNLIADAGKAIGGDDQFNDLIKGLNQYLQSEADQGRFLSDQTDKLKAMADARLQAIKRSPGGISFRRNLNTVIGGVGGIAVDAVTRDSSAGAGPAVKYQLKIHMSDTYHFNNHREGDQDRYRKLLRGLLSAGKFDQFEEAYNAEATLGIDSLPHPGLSRKWKALDDATIFASFMYALEMNGWTPGGLKWDVVVPTEITLVFKPPPKAPGQPAHKAPGH
jgi:hypothetical protein